MLAAPHASDQQGPAHQRLDQADLVAVVRERRGADGRARARPPSPPPRRAACPPGPARPWWTRQGIGATAPSTIRASLTAPPRARTRGRDADQRPVEGRPLADLVVDASGVRPRRAPGSRSAPRRARAGSRAPGPCRAGVKNSRRGHACACPWRPPARRSRRRPPAPPPRSRDAPRRTARRRRSRGSGSRRRPRSRRRRPSSGTGTTRAGSTSSAAAAARCRRAWPRCGSAARPPRRRPGRGRGGVWRTPGCAATCASVDERADAQRRRRPRP